MSAIFLYKFSHIIWSRCARLILQLELFKFVAFQALQTLHLCHKYHFNPSNYAYNSHFSISVSIYLSVYEINKTFRLKNGMSLIKYFRTFSSFNKSIQYLKFLRNNSRENWGVLRQRHPPLWHPTPCNIRETCLGKYWGWKSIMTSLVLTSMILNDEYFAIFL